MPSRRIEDLDPRVQDRARRILGAWAMAGLPVIVTCTLRTNEEQSDLYEMGRTKPGKRVTNAKAGESKHNPLPEAGARAMDVVPIVNGKAAWQPALFEQLAQIAKKADPSVEWGGDWKGFRDAPHFQWKLV